MKQIYSNLRMILGKLSVTEACGVECMIGSLMESRVGITAAQLAGGKMNI